MSCIFIFQRFFHGCWFVEISNFNYLVDVDYLKSYVILCYVCMFTALKVLFVDTLSKKTETAAKWTTGETPTSCSMRAGINSRQLSYQSNRVACNRVSSKLLPRSTMLSRNTRMCTSAQFETKSNKKIWIMWRNMCWRSAIIVRMCQHSGNWCT